MFQSSPVREGRALNFITSECQGVECFNPRPSAKDGRSQGSRYWTKLPTKFQSSPVREGRALRVQQANRYDGHVSILARPRRTGALSAVQLLIMATVFQSSPVREGRALIGSSSPASVSQCFNPRPSAKDGRSPRNTARSSASSRFQSSPVREGRALAPSSTPKKASLLFQSSPVREGRALIRGGERAEKAHGFNPRPSAKDGRSIDLLEGDGEQAEFQSSPVREGRALMPYEVIAKDFSKFQSSPVREGRALQARRHLPGQGSGFQSSPVREGRALLVVVKGGERIEVFQSSPVREGRALAEQ